MDATQWVLMLEPEEQGYVRRLYPYLQGTNGGIEPAIPPGMSKVHADGLRCHLKSFLNGQKGKRVMEEKKPTSIRMSDKLKRQLAYEASLLENVCFTDYCLRCINAGRPIVQAYPKKNFDDPRITDVVERNRN